MTSIVINEEDIIYEEDLNEEVLYYLMYIYYNKLFIKEYCRIIQLSNTTPDLEENAEIYITKQMTVKTILHSLTPIEYPPTSEDGVAIVYHVEGWQNVNSAFADVSIK